MMTSKKIYLDDPNVGQVEKSYLNSAIDAGFVSTAGPFVPEFEDIFAQYLHVPGSVSTQSGTAALHLALYELGIGQADEVIVPALTFVATVNPVLYVSATPVFADVDATTWNLDPKCVETLISKRTKAIIPVHLYGNPCQMKTILDIAEKYHLSIIEDAAESLGATYHGQYTGTFGEFGIFSFNGNKVMTTGGGGMVVGKETHRLQHIKFLANQARDSSTGFYHPEVGFNYRMTNLEAALGLAQMTQLDDFLAKKRRFHAIYDQELAGLEGLRFQAEYEYAASNFWLSCVLIEKSINIVELQEQLRGRGIPTRRVFMPIVTFPPYQRYQPNAVPNAMHIYERGLCLPSSTLNSEESIYVVCQAMRAILAGYRR